MLIRDKQPLNHLIADLPESERKRLIAKCETVELVFNETLTTPGEPLKFAWFPNQGFISLTVPADERSNLEVGLIGNEGMLGNTLVLGIKTAPLHALVQGAGQALRISVAHLQQQINHSPALEATLKKYLYVTVVQLSQTAACTRFHLVEARLARWLLMTRDRAESNQFRITQQFLAYMLGVRRVGITRAATALHQRQLINYHRGSITITDPSGLEASACSCYQIDKQTYQRIMQSMDDDLLDDSLVR
ncbi:Crp/Fnr family transcriptional regulator [Methylophaga sp.]|uniref:Crp/Fnr family transcriptional regulator n=1 Tax=Methylophaga sp. TaxID=2024840 RepID=UPI0027209201|nr:Crp/Fnr family transcriptional regulator [Methylophaga sp.]MDO8825026.1 Crp/Fnr family transcriptional regulator [Methylophaga sp.]